MTHKHGIPGEFEQLVLLAILRLGDKAYGSNISDLLEREAGRRVSRGALYSSLDRLHQKGLVKWMIEAATSVRGGHPKRLFEVTQSGMRALKAARSVFARLSAGLEELLGETGRCDSSIENRRVSPNLYSVEALGPRWRSEALLVI